MHTCTQIGKCKQQVLSTLSSIVQSIAKNLKNSVLKLLLHVICTIDTMYVLPSAHAEVQAYTCACTHYEQSVYSCYITRYTSKHNKLATSLNNSQPFDQALYPEAC